MARIQAIPPEFWSDSKSEQTGAGYWIYCIAEAADMDAGPCKIGIATRLGTRLSSLQCGNWRCLWLAWKIRLCDREQAKQTEQRLLVDFRPNPYDPKQTKRQLMSEWIDVSPGLVRQRAINFLEVTHEPIKRIW
jgi:hypothetical protein